MLSFSEHHPTTRSKRLLIMRCLILYFRDEDCGILETPCTYLHHALKIICNRREYFGNCISRCYLRNQIFVLGCHRGGVESIRPFWYSISSSMYSYSKNTTCVQFRKNSVLDDITTASLQSLSEHLSLPLLLFFFFCIGRSKHLVVAT
jgi:hypothetical protein